MTDETFIPHAHGERRLLVGISLLAFSIALTNFVMLGLIGLILTPVAMIVLLSAAATLGCGVKRLRRRSCLPTVALAELNRGHEQQSLPARIRPFSSPQGEVPAEPRAGVTSQSLWSQGEIPFGDRNLAEFIRALGCIKCQVNLGGGLLQASQGIFAVWSDPAFSVPLESRTLLES